MQRKSVVMLISFTLLLLFVSPASASVGSDRTVTVMTRNLDAGSDFGYVVQAASDPDATQLQLLLAITNTFQEMIASDIPGRAKRIAMEVHSRQPYLIGLQEVTTLRTGSLGAPASTVVVDGLKSLLDALAAKGLHYKAIAVQTNAAIDLPAFDATGNLITVGFTDYDAVLARTDLPTSQLKVSDIDMHHFNVNLPFTVAGQTIPFLRGWISLHAKVRGKKYKFVTTHLETFSPDIQAEQTNELLAGSLNSELPLILAGDLNSDANQPSWASGPAVEILAAAGFKDAWSKLHPITPGLTWPLFAEDPPGPATPRQRIDLIFTGGDDVKAKSIVRTGLSPSAKGVWGSDHAGVFATFAIQP
ncbi:MAG TPA: endonuclease/exonuclease/phosphatase family protein [Candidatus Binatia bacterium]|nr:endonuclease/exonuclease/phosphatase family protein [Candidatus Binatia bacterium]